MTSKLDLLAKLHQNLNKYILDIVKKPGYSMPTLSEMILYLQNNDIDIDNEEWPNTFKQKYPNDYEKFTLENIDKIKKYISAMLELLK